MPFAVLLAALAEVPDPRRAQGQRYSMRHLLLFSVLATLAGATSYQVYRPRLMRHLVAPYAARAAVESCSARIAAGGRKPCRSMSQVAL